MTIAVAKKSHGGARPGSGRKKGWRKLSAIQEKVASLIERGKKDTPLQVMLDYMWHLQANNKLDLAAEIAYKAAPFMHSRLASLNTDEDLGDQITVNIVKFGDKVPDEDEDDDEEEEEIENVDE